MYPHCVSYRYTFTSYHVIVVVVVVVVLTLTRLEPQSSRFGDKSYGIRMVCPQIRTVGTKRVRGHPKKLLEPQENPKNHKKSKFDCLKKKQETKKAGAHKMQSTHVQTELSILITWPRLYPLTTTISTYQVYNIEFLPCQQLLNQLVAADYSRAAAVWSAVPVNTCWGVCVLHIKPTFFLPVDIQLNQCTCRFINPRRDTSSVVTKLRRSSVNCSGQCKAMSSSQIRQTRHTQFMKQ